MPLVVTDEGERFLINLLLRDEVPADLVFILGLFQNNYVPLPGTILANFLEANFNGYLPLELARDGWAEPVTIDGRAQCVYGEEFLQFLPESGEQDIWGYYVRDADSNVCLWAERFSTKITVTTTQPVLLLPILRLHSEYEPTG